MNGVWTTSMWRSSERGMSAGVIQMNGRTEATKIASMRMFKILSEYELRPDVSTAC
jgi:hypothetical protein